MHPVNLAFRFLLELAALASLFAGGLRLGEGALRWLGALGLPLLAMVLWGTFAVPDDPSRGGGAPLPVPGWARLLLELAIFGTAVASLWLSQRRGLALGLGGAVVLHYLLSLERVRWLMEG